MVEMGRTPMCPMAGACRVMAEKPRFGLVLMVPGLAFIMLGVVVLIEPQILAWLVATALIVMGIGMLVMAGFMRSMGRRLQA